MKQKDITNIAIVVIIAGSFSLIFSNLVLSPRIKRDKAEVVVVISPDIPNVKSDPAYVTFYNSKALNPTQAIRIGDQQNQDPFRGGQQ